MTSAHGVPGELVTIVIEEHNVPMFLSCSLFSLLWILLFAGLLQVEKECTQPISPSLHASIAGVLLE